MNGQGSPAQLKIVMTENKKSKKPFKQTKALVRLALNEGWTQKEIGDKCRSHQSIVSKWKKGTQLGTEEQLRPLLDLFGHKIRKNTFKLYYGVDKETKKRIYYKVEGRVILSLNIREPDERIKRKSIPVYKIHVHNQGKDKFRVVLQTRSESANIPWNNYDESEGGIWQSKILVHHNSEDLINYFDNLSELYCKNHLNASSMPFQIRQALLNHGVIINEIVEVPTDW